MSSLENRLVLLEQTAVSAKGKLRASQEKALRDVLEKLPTKQLRQIASGVMPPGIAALLKNKDVL